MSRVRSDGRHLGLVAGVVILLVAHTYRVDEAGDEVIRIVSARKATARERWQYEQLG